MLKNKVENISNAYPPVWSRMNFYELKLFLSSSLMWKIDNKVIHYKKKFIFGVVVKA